MANYLNFAAPGWAGQFSMYDSPSEQDRLRQQIRAKKATGQDSSAQEMRLYNLTMPSNSGPSEQELKAQADLDAAFNRTPRNFTLLPNATRSARSALTSNATSNQSQPSTMSVGENDLGTGRQMLSRALAQLRAPVDVSALNEFAKQRAQQGDSAMLNALAAQFAGERFAPVQAQYLKRSMESQSPMKIGNYGTIAGGRFVADPYAQRDMQTDAELKSAAELIASEDRRYGSQLDLQEAMFRGKSGVNGLTPGQLQISARRVGDLAQKADAAKNALAAIPSMEEAINKMPEGLFQPIVSNLAQVGAALGSSRAEKLAGASQLADAISKQFGIAKLSDIGGNDTDRELMVAITTTYNGTNLREVNKKLLKLFKDVSQRNVSRFNDAQRWQSKHGSIYSVDENDLTFDEWFENKYEKPSNVQNGSQSSSSSVVEVEW